MEYLHEIFEDWKSINTVKRLRGACFLASRLCMKNKQYAWYHKFYNFTCKLRTIKKMNKEQININLMSICIDLNLL